MNKNKPRGRTEKKIGKKKKIKKGNKKKEKLR
jgi:hypothetical protein